MQEMNRHAKSASQVIRVSELCWVLLQNLSFCFGKTSECDPVHLFQMSVNRRWYYLSELSGLSHGGE